MDSAPPALHAKSGFHGRTADARESLNLDALTSGLTLASQILKQEPPAARESPNKHIKYQVAPAPPVMEFEEEEQDPGLLRVLPSSEEIIESAKENKSPSKPWREVEKRSNPVGEISQANAPVESRLTMINAIYKERREKKAEDIAKEGL